LQHDLISRWPAAKRARPSPPETTELEWAASRRRPRQPLTCPAAGLSYGRVLGNLSGEGAAAAGGEIIMNKPQTKEDRQGAAKQVYRELVTINGKNVVLAHNEPPVINAGVLEYGEIFRMFNIFDEKFSPSNIDKADGTPLRLYTSDRVKVDVSKRRKHDMGFWHRNIDAHEIIFCVKGALKWETEMGVKVMHPGDMLFIPKGIGHRSMLCEDSTDDNVLIELKIADDLTFVGDNAK
jgi:mannose-6-phosphate isomerase-like protein (cupin superfamily)